MSNSKNANKITEKSRIESQKINNNEDKGETNSIQNEGYTYAVTVSKKGSPSGEETNPCAGQKSFISIHSTDQLCQLSEVDNPANLDECNVEVLSLNEVFPSTSEESVSNDESPIRRKRHKNKTQKSQFENTAKSTYTPSNSKSFTTSTRQVEAMEAQASVHSDFDIPKNTLYVTGSNPGEPKMSYQDPPKKMSKTMKKFLRNIDKHKNEHMSKSTEKAISKLTTMRGILKDGRCVPECTGDSTLQDSEDYSNTHWYNVTYNKTRNERVFVIWTPSAHEPSISPKLANVDGKINHSADLSLPFAMNFEPQMTYTKQPDKNVSFNTQVVIIHFTGDLCVGQSVEALSKEKDQQARNSELRKTFLSKYNELWPTQK